MNIGHKTHDISRQKFYERLLARIRPTEDTGLALEIRKRQMQSLVADKCGEFGALIAVQWPQGEREVCMNIPIYMSEDDRIDAVVQLSVCLYDDIEHPRTN